jgi:hypothetical protein
MNDDVKKRLTNAIEGLQEDATGFSLNWEDEMRMCWVSGSSVANGQWTIFCGSSLKMQPVPMEGVLGGVLLELKCKPNCKIKGELHRVPIDCVE